MIRVVAQPTTDADHFEINIYEGGNIPFHMKAYFAENRVMIGTRLIQGVGEGKRGGGVSLWGGKSGIGVEDGDPGSGGRGLKIQKIVQKSKKLIF